MLTNIIKMLHNKVFKVVCGDAKDIFVRHHLFSSPRLKQREHMRLDDVFDANTKNMRVNG